MSHKILFRKLAQSELSHAVVWYEQQKPGLGVEFAGRVEKSLNLISDNPEIFAPVLGVVRKKTLRPFSSSIYYRIRGEMVIILAVFHNKRAPEDWQSRR